MYGIFDPKDLSDDELFSRIMRARHFIGVHIQQGNDSIVDSIELTLATMEEEQEYRSKMKEQEYQEENKKRKATAVTRKSRNEKEEIKTKPDDGTITLGHISGVDD